jgi:hypothetical protein
MEAGNDINGALPMACWAGVSARDVRFDGFCVRVLRPQGMGQGEMRGYTLLVRAAAFEEMGFAERAMDLYHDAALDEKRRREVGEQPDDRHLTYL